MSWGAGWGGPWGGGALAEIDSPLSEIGGDHAVAHLALHLDIFGSELDRFTFDGQLHILKSDGTHLPGWPKTTGHWIYSPPSVGDVNGDGDPDVVIADYFHEIVNPSNQI